MFDIDHYSVRGHDIINGIKMQLVLSLYMGLDTLILLSIQFFYCAL